MNVYDFDNTIYDGESIFDIFLYFLKKDFKNIIKYAPKFIKDFIRYKFDKITVDEAMASYGAAFKDYCQKYDNINDEFEKFWDINQKKLKQFYFDIQQDRGCFESDFRLSPPKELHLRNNCGGRHVHPLRRRHHQADDRALRQARALSHSACLSENRMYP
jgi:hypothetical protein